MAISSLIQSLQASVKLSRCLKHDSATLCLCSRGRSMADQAKEALAWQNRFSLELECAWWAVASNLKGKEVKKVQFQLQL